MKRATKLPHQFYVLRGKRVYKATLLQWARAQERLDGRIVAQSDVCKVFVSTVFIGLDMQMRIGGPRRVFETMVFDRSHKDSHLILHDYSRRYSTWREAMAGHTATCLTIRQSMRKGN